MREALIFFFTIVSAFDSCDDNWRLWAGDEELNDRISEKRQRKREREREWLIKDRVAANDNFLSEILFSYFIFTCTTTLCNKNRAHIQCGYDDRCGVIIYVHICIRHTPAFFENTLAIHCVSLFSYSMPAIYQSLLNNCQRKLFIFPSHYKVWINCSTRSGCYRFMVIIFHSNGWT